MKTERTVPLWMPLNIADYHKDTQHLSTLEHGAYFLLLMHCWTTGGTLPGDEKRLMRIARMSQKEWNRSRETLIDFFFRHGDGFQHKRINAELAKADEFIEQKREAGRKSAATRAQRSLNGRSTDVPTGTPTDGQRRPNQSQSQTQEDKTPSSVSRARTAPDEPQLPADVRSVLDEGGFVSPPPDLVLLRHWYAAGATLDQDILPTIRRVRPQLSKAPFKLKVFDAAVREKLAADEREIEHLRRVAARNAPEQAGAGAGR